MEPERVRMRIDVEGNSVHDLARRWQYDGCKEEGEARKRMLDNDGDPVKAMCMFHSAARKLQCVIELRQAMKDADNKKEE